ncbi:tetratricopeptide repeat protein [Variovorax terrae]|uniref:Tetratricopeptide repeat protein n=1 Tax=Variovorax terrae TaxID=2923278 RepID=A0A9X2AMN1_9BURK|nr:tetratricopeptide repeat protein [Variovorax terrae]MCJ0763908.1 tetratricopeptide repeat protein [Variovorax terrae]
MKKPLHTIAAGCLAILASACSTAPSGYGIATGPRPPAASVEDPQVNTAATYLTLIRQMQQRGLWFASLAHIDALEQQWGTSPEAALLRADALRQTGQAASSEQAYRKLMGTALEAAGYRGLGLLAAAQGDYARAIQMFEQAQRRSPTDALLLSDLGYAYMKAGRLAQARIPIMQAAQLQPEMPKVQGNFALYLLVDGKPQQAGALMDKHGMPDEVRAVIAREAAEMRLDSSSAGVPMSEARLQEGMNMPLTLKTSSSLLSTGSSER